jgi:S-adenosylmethionine hydrolase
MKGVILAINPQASIIDVSHQVCPQAIARGAFLLAMAVPYFPVGTVHVAVVDPGVGTGRCAPALQTPTAIYVGPDNGVLSAALPRDLRARALPPVSLLPLQWGDQAVALESRRCFREAVSATFRGRDSFAPVAARPSLGVPLSELGRSLPRIQALPPFGASRQALGSLRAPLCISTTLATSSPMSGPKTWGGRGWWWR